MRGSSFKSFLVTVAALGLAVPIATQAAISFGLAGTGVLTFDAAPAATEWSTLPLAGAGNTILDETAMDAAVQALTAASIATTLPTSATIVPGPSTSALGARYNTAGLFLQTRPTAVAAVVLLATLSNDSGLPQTAVDITYVLNRYTLAATPGELVGHDVYYSLTGAAGEWVKIPALTRMETPGTLPATIAPAGGWPAGTPLYLLWADDNADGITDPSYTMDNLSVIPSGAPPTISVQPTPMVTVNERGTLTLSVIASGSAITFQWFKGATALANGASCGDGHDKTIGGATGSTLTIAGVQPSDSGLYHCEVSGPNPPSPAVSMNANVMVTPDGVAPTVLYALCGANLNEFVVVFSEQMYDSCQPLGFGPASEIGNWIIQDVGGNTLGTSGVTNMVPLQTGQTVLGLTTSLTHDPTKAVQIMWTADLPDASMAQNILPVGSVMALCFTNELLAVNAVWRYNDTGADLGQTWYNGDDSTLPFTGPGPFDCKRDNNNPGALPYCRAVQPNIGPVGTCTQLSNTTTLTFITNHYYRTHFNYSGNPATTFLALDTYIDDGGIIYLNGTELQRVRMPAGPVSNVTFAGGGNDAQLEPYFYLPGSPIQSGDNVIAAQVHQSGANSSDLTWGCRVSVLVSAPPLRVSISYDGAGHVTVSWSGGTSAGTLRSTTSITTARPWPVVTGNPASPYTTTSTGPQRFYEVSDP